ncbi:MAG: bifunctional DNA-formamidopyrimidine glycosylase/DNA-(apurinic or apyrimidinic site) lyase [Candidatus Omnitrophota bacterium]|nr:bifunctional DNA-formamidopyrimidine glycosylase/DNA-(apurinic or apyrimidinic site) lyase [Candidatus Omnitrophota bacterium]
MPELPEVETLVIQLKQRIQGKILSQVTVIDERILESDPKSFTRDTREAKVLKIRRDGKFIGLELDRDRIIWFHLGMTGRLYWMKPSDEKLPHTHLLFSFADIQEQLCFRDVRRFGRALLTATDPESFPEGVRLLGPEPLDISADEFTKVLCRRTGRIKSLLLNQRIIAGLGNIYADEALHRAGIDPRKRPLRLSRKRLCDLHAAICETLKEAIASGGSTIQDYLQLDGKGGNFQTRHRVYGHGGKPCAGCGGLIRKIVIAGRSAHFCPSCQQ